MTYPESNPLLYPHNPPAISSWPDLSPIGAYLIANGTHYNGTTRIPMVHNSKYGEDWTCAGVHSSHNGPSYYDGSVDHKFVSYNGFSWVYILTNGNLVDRWDPFYSPGHPDVPVLTNFAAVFSDGLT